MFHFIVLNGVTARKTHGRVAIRNVRNLVRSGLLILHQARGLAHVVHNCWHHARVQPWRVDDFNSS